ncbi:MAG: Lyzozyme M1 (1,4-beta-N-acetylmuramidase) [Lachnospiraceae bacterium]|nr:glycoside hydrolase family 25 protein [uncultured Acetatifactor sp.]MCI8286424.1 Lyzozyme M1 (1,4-beta-N-acetylmuramidase) [Lachnospiraceae bacterium]
MKMPDDFDDRSNLTPTVVMAIVAVSVFVAIILLTVLFTNDRRDGNATARQTEQNESVQASGDTGSSVVLYPETDELLTGSSLHPDDFDFWDMYPEPEATPEPTQTPEAVVENDPSTDGKHTLVQYADGKEEWVLISPYLPKHEYDFTKLVCQSSLMKYYEDGKQTSYVGVDISKYQDYVDFVKVKKAGINFVMLRVGARGYGTGQLILDEYFSENLKRATDAGLDVGVYFFSQAITKEEAVEEANMVIENLGEYQITYPVAYDMELVENDTARTDKLTKSEKTEMAKTFLDTIAAAGYKTMIYGNKEWLIKEIDMSKLTSYDVWLSQVADIPDYPYKFTMWQYQREGSVDGIAGYVNMNISFINYAEK